MRTREWSEEIEGYRCGENGCGRGQEDCSWRDEVEEVIEDHGRRLKERCKRCNVDSYTGKQVFSLTKFSQNLKKDQRMNECWRHQMLNLYGQGGDLPSKPENQ